MYSKKARGGFTPPLRSLMKPRARAGFTFIEILMTLTVIGLLFIPVMQLFSNSLLSTNINLDMITAMNLAQSEMERTLNLNLTKAQLQEMGTQVLPPDDKPPLELNRAFWRTKREIVPDSDPLEIRILVYKDETPDRHLVKLVTLVEDMMWEQVKTVSSG